MCKLLILLGLIGLAACSGNVPDDAGLSRHEQASAMMAELAQENLSNPALLPHSGTARYAGFAVVTIPTENTSEPQVADLTLYIGFGAADPVLSGQIDGFDTMSGALAITGGRLYRGHDPDDDYALEADVAGNLQADGSMLSIDADLLADFRGRNQDGLTGVLYGTVTSHNDVDIFAGDIAAARID